MWITISLDLVHSNIICFGQDNAASILWKTTLDMKSTLLCNIIYNSHRANSLEGICNHNLLSLKAIISEVERKHLEPVATSKY